MAREEELKEEEGDDDADDESGDDDDDAPKVKEACAERKAADAAAATAKAAKAAHAEFGVPRPMELRREIASLARRVYAAGSDRNKTRTLLCSVYHHALHGRYFEARDMLLTSHLGDAIHDRDIQTQILYNRAMARCGLCAFELQLLPEAHSALMELAGGSRLKEMLAQGISNSHFRDRAAEKEQEKAERRRLVPYHMWINLDLVEAVHLVTAMLLELPNLAHNAYDPKRRSAPVSRTFRRYLDQHERQVFTGPPEGTRDYVMRTSKLLLDGEWKRAADLVCEMPVWSLLPKKEGIHEYLRKQMRESGLRAYLISSYAHFDALAHAPRVALRAHTRRGARRRLEDDALARDRRVLGPADGDGRRQQVGAVEAAVPRAAVRRQDQPVRRVERAYPRPAHRRVRQGRAPGRPPRRLRQLGRGAPPVGAAIRPPPRRRLRRRPLRRRPPRRPAGRTAATAAATVAAAAATAAAATAASAATGRAAGAAAASSSATARADRRAGENVLSGG